MIDYMVNNRWVFDYVTYTQRLNPNGGVANSILAASGAQYPLPIPDLDWLWMAGALIALIASIATVLMAGKGTSAAKPAPAQSVAATSGT